MLDRLKAIFLCLIFNDLCLTSENVLRREACILARVRQDLILHMKALCLFMLTQNCYVRKVILIFQQDFGRQLIAPQEQLRKATVILNPAACNG